MRAEVKKAKEIKVQISKIIKMREEKGLSRSKLSLLMGYNRPQMGLIEGGERSFSKDSLEAFKVALGLETIPVTISETIEFRRSLHSWKDLLLTGQTTKATAMLEDVSYAVKHSCDDDLKMLFMFYLAVYQNMVGDIRAFEKSLALIEKKKAEEDFTKEYDYWYHRVRGYNHLFSWQYKDALAEFLKCEELSKLVLVKDDELEYKIAYCLTFMGYASQAIKILEKIEHMTNTVFYGRYGLLIQFLLAENYRNLDDDSKSLDLLEMLMYWEKGKIKELKFEGPLYYQLADTYRKLGDLNKAIENIDRAIEYVGHDGEPYALFLYKKACILDEQGKNILRDDCINEGLKIYPSDESLFGLFFNILKHSFQLDDVDSFKYLETVSIPKLLNRGMNLEVIGFYKKLIDYCDKNTRLRKGLALCVEITRIQDNLIKGAYVL